MRERVSMSVCGCACVRESERERAVSRNLVIKLRRMILDFHKHTEISL